MHTINYFSVEQYRNLEVVLHYSTWELCVLMDPYGDKLVIPSCSLCSRCILILSGFLSKLHKFLFSAVKFIMSVTTFVKHSMKLSGRNSWKWVIMQEAEMHRIGAWKNYWNCIHCVPTLDVIYGIYRKTVQR